MKNDKIANCTFAFKCPRSWDDLTLTNSESVRFCSACDQEVYFAEDEETFGMLAATGKCVAIRDNLRVDSGDEEKHEFLLGIPCDETDSSPRWPLFLDCAHDSLRGNAPGCLLNNNEPGSDGNYYSIARNAERQALWDLFQCIPQYFFAPGFAVSPVGVGLTVEELYSRIEFVNIFIQGHEAIALGLPFHRDNY